MLTKLIAAIAKREGISLGEASRFVDDCVSERWLCVPVKEGEAYNAALTFITGQSLRVNAGCLFLNKETV